MHKTFSSKGLAIANPQMTEIWFWFTKKPKRGEEEKAELSPTGGGVAERRWDADGTTRWRERISAGGLGLGLPVFLHCHRK